MTFEQHIHLCEGIVDELEHLMDVVILMLIEVLFRMELPVDGSAHIVAGIADRLQFRDLPEHGAYLALCLIGEVGVAHLVEIFGDLYLHIVGDVLIFLYPLIDLLELILVLLFEEVSHHAEHALYALGKALDLFLRLEHGELRCLHDTTLNETQAEIVVVCVGTRFPHHAAHLGYLFDKREQHDGV